MALSSFRPLVFRKRRIGRDGAPAICVSLMSATVGDLVDEACALLAKGDGPDVLEWRADFFADAHDASMIATAATRLRAGIESNQPSAGLIFTLRHRSEGGQSNHGDSQALAAYRAACESGSVDAIDTEFARADEFRTAVKAAAKTANVAVIFSAHDFVQTPPRDQMLQRLRAMAGAGADVVKLAVMPQHEADVNALLDAVSHASREIGVPIVAMSMGELGKRSRIEGARFGSAMSFAAGRAASAPGQIAIDDLKSHMRAAGIEI